jgi:NAD-dependent deacetylase
VPDATHSDTLVGQLARADRVTVLTGAGASAESGIPTFRDPDGLWEQFEPQELANVEAFLDNPSLVQGWYAHRRQLTQDAEPNPAHHALARFEQCIEGFTLVTQNVDNLHQRAGSTNVVELHGNITRNYCIDCERPASDAELESLADGEPALCPNCGGYIRPDVVWFGEMLPQDAIQHAHEAATQADVFLSVGTSAVVHPAAGLPLTAKEHGAYLVEVNVDATAITSAADEVLRGKAGRILPPLAEAVAAQSSHV